MPPSRRVKPFMIAGSSSLHRVLRGRQTRIVALGEPAPGSRVRSSPSAALQESLGHDGDTVPERLATVNGKRFVTPGCGYNAQARPARGADRACVKLQTRWLASGRGPQRGAWRSGPPEPLPGGVLTASGWLRYFQHDTEGSVGQDIEYPPLSWPTSLTHSRRLPRGCGAIIPQFASSADPRRRACRTGDRSGRRAPMSLLR